MKTKIFSYADKTWPEIADLHRDTPLVIPLGSKTDLNLLSEALGNPPQFGMLPALQRAG